jgi:hypothetical protein
VVTAVVFSVPSGLLAQLVAASASTLEAECGEVDLVDRLEDLAADAGGEEL